MCGRFTLTVDSLEFVEAVQRLNVKLFGGGDFKPRFNIAPTQLHPIILADGEQFAAQPARWGLVNFWAKDTKRAARQINARSESVAESRAYARPFKRQRCLVPADGWYEWSGPKNQRQPHWIHRADREPFVFAGLYDIWHPEPDRPAVTFTILTREASEALANIHSRMPVVLPPDRHEEWLDPGNQERESTLALLDVTPDDSFISMPVSSRVNAVKHDDPSLLEVEEQPSLELQ
ncbi:MAG: SOS response-associated peptidase [Chloroflexota bacterium]|nr:SOS response-associated peptidase [Chloroflexota bacterium]MDE2896389.1 SOS response-associated peptidase [Chloroflexota bacterium]